MFTKVLIICVVAAAAFAVEYPPGIHPSICPNYPLCDMEVLARHTPQGVPIPDWEIPYARMMVDPIPVVAQTEPIEYPAGVDPVTCPNYPYCA